MAQGGSMFFSTGSRVLNILYRWQERIDQRRRRFARSEQTVLAGVNPGGFKLQLKLSGGTIHEITLRFDAGWRLERLESGMVQRLIADHHSARHQQGPERRRQPGRQGRGFRRIATADIAVQHGDRSADTRHGIGYRGAEIAKEEMRRVWHAIGMRRDTAFEYENLAFR